MQYLTWINKQCKGLIIINIKANHSHGQDRPGVTLNVNDMRDALYVITCLYACLSRGPGYMGQST